MIFKPKVKSNVKQKVRNLLVRAPIFAALALACLVGHPARADAEELLTLSQNMKKFIDVQDYHMTQTNGRNLNNMFHLTGSQKLEETKQYIAYYTVDKKSSNSKSWSTYAEYWHGTEWYKNSGNAKYNGHKIPEAPEKAVADRRYGKDIIYYYRVNGDTKGDKDIGKASFTGSYKTNLDSNQVYHVSGGDIGTLHYFSSDAGTKTGDKLLKFLDEKSGTVTFYISPIILSNYDHKLLYDFQSWYTHQLVGVGHWGAYNRGDWEEYYVHYNIPIRFKANTASVISSARLIGGQKTEDSDTLIQSARELQQGSDSARAITKDDYIFSAEGEPLTDKNGKEYKKVTKQAFDYFPFNVNDPAATAKNGKGLTMFVDHNTGQSCAYMCVGYRIMKKAQTRAGTKNVILASSMIQLRKDSSGDYVPYFVGDDDATKTDEVDGQPISKPQSVLDKRVVVKRYDVYGLDYSLNMSTGVEKCAPVKSSSFRKGDKISVRKWEQEMSDQLNWCMNSQWGVRNEKDDSTSELYVDWLYAKVSQKSENKITLDTYYTSDEGFNIDTDEFPSVDDSKDLEYNHDQATEANSKLVDSNVIATVQAGSPWVSYSVKQDANGAYVLKDGTKVPKKSSSMKLQATGSKSTQFKNTRPVKQISKSDLQNICYKNRAGETLAGMTTPAIPYIIKKNAKDSFKSSCNNYLYKVVITTDKDDVWTEFTAKDIWGSHTPANGKIVKNKSTNRSYTTYAPFMRNYVYTTYGTPGMIKSKDADWESDAFAMTHFIIPEVRCNVTIKAYYTTTLPVRTYTYVKKTDGSPFVLDASKTKMSWVSPGVTYKGTYDDSRYVTAIMACTGWHAWSTPYANLGFRKEQFSSVSAAEKYYPDHTNLNATTGNFSVKMKSDTVVICIFIDESTSKYFTQVQYVHTADGSYHLVKSWRQPIRTPSGKSTTESHKTSRTWINGYYDDPEKKTGWHSGYWSYSSENKTFYSTMTRAFVSFPKYVSWDDGNTGLYGSLYEDKFVTYEYNSSESFATNPKFAQTRTSMPGTYTGTNNQEYYLTSKGDDVYRKTGSKASADNADRTAGGDNSLVVYCIYEDIFSNWVNDDYHPENHSKDAKTEEESALPWNWLLPNGYVWANQDIESKDTVDETQYSQEYTNPYIAQVLATQGSAAYNAQEGIPTTDKLRTAAQVPRYVTKGYWNKEKLDYAYKIYAVYVKQHREVKKVTVNNNPDAWPLNKDESDKTDGGTYDYSTVDDCVCEYDYYTSETVQQSESREVVRHSVYYTLGDAEVWDPYLVTLKDDVFSDSNISSDHLVSLYPNGKLDGYASNARFFKTGDGAYTMPTLSVKRQYVNYGTYNDWEGSTDPSEDLEDFTNDAESIVGKFSVKNDTVTFYNGNGQTYQLAEGNNFVEITQIPSFPPEAELTYAGIFDSANTTPEGITVEPETNNGHHETCSIAYYKQIQVIPTERYRTNEHIKTKIADDGDDDVLVYTPTVNESRINLDYNDPAQGNDNLPLNPTLDFDQATDHEIEQTLHNIQLDREYTVTISVEGTASDLDGYGYQNYVRYLAHDENDQPYTQIKFPFPVQMVIRTMENDSLKTANRYFFANTWINLEMIDENGKVQGTINQTFFVPSWATEKESATIRYRSIAINAKANNPSLSMEYQETNDSFVDEEFQTADRHNAMSERDYVAWQEETDTVTGRISSFQIIDVSDYPTWQPVFREYDKTLKKYTNALCGRAYRSGACNEYGFIGSWGSLYTTPVFGSSNPAGASMGTLGLGYRIRYKMTTVGPYYNQTDKVSFTPEFYFVNDKGEYLQLDGSYSTDLNNRAKVDVYYSETVKGSRQTLIKVGSKQDKNNVKSLNLADDEWGVSADRINFTNSILNSSNVGTQDQEYTFGKTTLTSAMRTIDGDQRISAHRGNKLAIASQREFPFNNTMYSIVKNLENGQSTDENEAALKDNLTTKQIARSVQTWYGEYYLPSDTYVTTKSWETIKRQIVNGFDGSEDCWLKGGHLVINFNPTLTSETHQTLRYSVEQKYSLTVDGNTKYTYGGCNQFKNENCVTSKMTATGESIPLAAGDVLVYDFAGGEDAASSGKAKSAKDAYSSNGSH